MTMTPIAPSAGVTEASVPDHRVEGEPSVPEKSPPKDPPDLPFMVTLKASDALDIKDTIAETANDPATEKARVELRKLFGNEKSETGRVKFKFTTRMDPVFLALVQEVRNIGKRYSEVWPVLDITNQKPS